MRSLSSIIKGERIRNQSIIDFSIRQVEWSIEENDVHKVAEENEENIEEDITCYKEKRLKEIQELIDAKLAQADEQINEMLSDAITKAKAIEKEAKQLKNDMLFELTEEKQKILDQAYKQAEGIIVEAYKEKDELIMNTEEELVDTLLLLLNHIISEEMHYQTDWLKCLVRKMLRKDEILGDVKVIISPILYDRLPEEERVAVEVLQKGLVVETKDNLNETTCIIECSQGSIVYDVTQGLERVINDTRILMSTK